jgi:outer membrane receptor protein involved in Fe transport
MLKVGGEVKRLGADYAYANVTRHTVRLPNDDITQGFDSIQVDLEPEGHEVSAYLAARLRPIDRLTTEVGVRYDDISHTGDQDVAPRLLAAFDLSDRTTLRASWGRYYQSHGLHELQVGDGATDFETSERADQAAVGFEHGFPGGVRLRVELYDRRMPNPRPLYINLEQELEIFPEATEDRFRFEADRARAHGLEIFLDRRAGTRWAWSASYVLARAEDELDGRWIPRRFDQRHTVSLNATYRPNRHWNLTAGWRYHTGWPATSWTWDVTPLSSGWNWWDRRFGALRGERLPAYHRLDLRVTRDFVVAGNALHAFVDLFNVYDRTNLGSFDYNGNFVDNQVFVSQVNGQEMLPLLPTFGFRYEF